MQLYSYTWSPWMNIQRDQQLDSAPISLVAQRMNGKLLYAQEIR